MTSVYILAILLCFSQVVLTTYGHPAGEDGEWVDDVSNDPEMNAEPVANSVKEDDGEWVDDVTGNMFIMGEDPLTQSTGLSGKVHTNVI